MLPASIEKKVIEFLAQEYNETIVVYTAVSLPGGSINYAFHLRTSHGEFFLKYNYAGTFPAMFEKEARGLELLHQSNTARVPLVIHYDEVDDYSFLLLEYIKSSKQRKDFWIDFAQSLAALHRIHNVQFGLDHDNYMGSLYQWNIAHHDWIGFFIDERLERQLKLARDDGKIDTAGVAAFQRLFTRLHDILPVEKPSLLHGDLWSGNFMIDDSGRVCIIDPAVYFGHREIDIAMSKLFGGFHFNFYAEYNKAFPMEAGWQERVDIYNLYPLMVHVNLFGGGYMGSVKNILKSF